MQLDRLRSFCCLKWWALFLGTLLSQCLLSFDLHAAEINFSGYAKSYNSWQERIDLPLLQTDASLQSQNSLRLTLEGFGKTAGVDSVWQLHYEVSPIISSVSSNLSDSTFSASSDAYRLTDLRSTVGAETIGILQYTQLSFPLILAMFAGGWLALKFLFPPDIQDIEAARKALKHKST